MGSYLLVFTVAALAAALLMPLLMVVGGKVGALDDTQRPPIPRVGGWAIVLGAVISLFLVGVIFRPTGLTLQAQLASLATVAATAFAILLLGTVDDVRPLPAWTKLLVQIVIALVAYALGIRIELLTAPLGSVELAPVLSVVLTVLWLVGIANAFNLLDGADGVAAGSAFFSATAILIMSVVLGRPAVGLVTAGIAGALLGFLPFNFPPARAYLGDAGSMVTGFVLAALAVEAATKGATLVAIAVPIVAFGVPVFDTTITLIRRLVRGRPLFERDREHVHHVLERAGLSPRQVLRVIYLASAAFALAAMVFLNPWQRSYAVSLIMIGAGVWLVARYLRLHELNELARVARRGLLQPRMITLNVELRRAAERLMRATTVEDLKQGLGILLRRSEFDEVLLLVGPESERRGNSQRWRLEGDDFVEGWPTRGSDEWEVVCPFGGAGWVGELHLRRRLGRRSLLLDLNLLLEVLQPALTQAAHRIDAATVLTG